MLKRFLLYTYHQRLKEQIYQNIISSWGMGLNQYKDLLITANEDYDYAVLLNCATTSKELPKSNVIGFSHEPKTTLRGFNQYFINYVQDSVSEYYISNNSGLTNSFIEGFSFVCPHEYGQSKDIDYTEKHENINTTKTHRHNHAIFRRCKPDLA
jgi:uncharacterized protein YydD (DUF2326 family)